MSLENRQRGKKEFGHKFKTHGEFLLILCRNDNLLMLKKHFYICVCVCVYLSWVSVLQNSKDEALNTALGGDQLHLQDSGLQELSRAIISELRQMPGNDSCADCGAPGWGKKIIELNVFHDQFTQLHTFISSGE